MIYERVRPAKASSRIYKEYYEQNKDKTTSLTIQYLPHLLSLVSTLVKESNGIYNFEDALTIAIIQSVRCEKSFNPELGSFATFIDKRVKGAIIDEYRTVPRRAQELQNGITKFVLDYVDTQGVYPDEDTIKQGLNLSDLQYKKLSDASTTPKFVDIDNAELTQPVSDDTYIDSVKQLICTFPLEVKTVLFSTFINEMSYKEINEEFGIPVRKIKHIVHTNVPKLRQLMIDNGLDTVDEID